jgi:hypothetical protein
LTLLREVPSSGEGEAMAAAMFQPGGALQLTPQPTAPGAQKHISADHDALNDALNDSLWAILS